MEVMLFMIVVAFLIHWGVKIYNRLNPFWHKLDEERANIEVVMHKRAQLTNRLVESVRRYVGHERLVHMGISADRNRFPNSDITGTRQPNMVFFTGLAVSFPELKADQTFTRLMSDLSVLEADVQRQYEKYNVAAREYNSLRSSLPVILYAPLMGFVEAEYLEPSRWYPAGGSGAESGTDLHTVS